MNEQENTETARRAYELFKEGDIESLMDLYTDDADWENPQTENVPHTGKRKGKEQMLEFMSLVGEYSENLHFEPREFVAQGDKVVVLGDYKWRIKPTGKEYESDFVHVCTFNDEGKITAFKEYLDTAKARDAYTAQEAQAA
ncbi:MAG: nuclear transport factor 2 family protein [Acidobacteria bacterium]|nr:nuclear transport factor 2 family protein [Acidobacteriota bacterium]MCA1637130.1 nuclear transport factor 2 family protein [Acidobacteriota bacterium]